MSQIGEAVTQASMSIIYGFTCSMISNKQMGKPMLYQKEAGQQQQGADLKADSQ